jgi:hypothetical protein
MIGAVKHRICVREMHGSNLTRDTDYPDGVLVVFVIPSRQILR